ncbi:MAG: SDR family oxidoreductase [Balneolales bacterium]
MIKKKILLTGASRGIGFHIALNLASLGHSVVCVARSSDKLHDLSQKYPGQLIPYPADISITENITRLIEDLDRRFGNIDLIIHNAGGITVKPFDKLSDEDWQYQLDVNLLSAVKLFRGTLPLLNAGAHILTISSMGGFQGSAKFSGLTAYSVSKGALTILSECLAAELSNQKISVNCLCLGAVQTEMLTKAFPGFQAPVTAKEMADYISDFGLTGHRFYNGKILPVALSDPG